ncbi:MAG: FecR family protein [Gemmatimonadales bacterium]
MDALIERYLRDECDEQERRRLAEWRAESPANERHFQAVARIVTAAHALEIHHGRPAPSAAALLGRRRQRQRPRSVVSAAVLLGLAAAAALTLFVWRSSSREATVLATDIVTGMGEVVTVPLRDGSVVRLAPSSRLTVLPSGGDREVRLEGRAFFAVARNTARPFRVLTKGGEVQVLGTRFEVATDSTDLALVVVEGRVALAAGESRVEVGAGERGEIRQGTVGSVRPVSVAVVDSAMGWVGRFMAFHVTPLRDAAREINRIFGVTIEIADPQLARQTVTATFTDQSLEQVMEVVCTIVGAQCRAQDGGFVMTRGEP